MVDVARWKNEWGLLFDEMTAINKAVSQLSKKGAGDEAFCRDLRAARARLLHSRATMDGFVKATRWLVKEAQEKKS